VDDSKKIIFFIVSQLVFPVNFHGNSNLIVLNFRKIIKVFNHIKINISLQRTNIPIFRTKINVIMNHLDRIVVKKSVIYQEGLFTITVDKTFDNTILALLRKTIYGTKGPKYQHTGQELKLQNLKNPIFFILRKQDETIGFYCLSEREIWVNQEKYLGYYGRYLAIDENHQGNGFGKLLKKKAVEYVESNSISPSVLYSYIEENNTRSFNISQKMGFETISTLETVLFSRLYPTADNRVARIDKVELPEILEKLELQYSHTFLRTFENINYQNNYFVLKENGRIVAGLQANPTRWKIVEMGGVGGKILLNVLPHIPILKRLINPEKYDFMAIEGIFMESNSEEYLYPLIEGVLHHFSMSSALFQLDSQSAILNLFKKRGDLGLLNAMKKDLKTNVTIKSINNKSPVPHGEAYVSSFDFT
jgi:L-amino acid N-acyltransferase YncA